MPREDYHQQLDFTVQYMNASILPSFPGPFNHYYYYRQQDDIVWVVPNADVLPFWIALFKIFNRNVWLASILCYVLTSAVIRAIAVFIPNERAEYKQMAWIAVNTFRMVTGTGPNQSPRALTARLLIFIWAVFGFYWTSSYTTILISMITTPQYLRNVISHQFCQQISKN